MSKDFAKVFIALFVFCLAGCAWFKKQGPVAARNPPLSEKYQILDEARLKEGGKLLVIPFSAGANVEATDELETASLYIVKGIGETLMANDSRFEVLMAEESQDAELILRGHITNFNKVKNFTEIFKPKEIVLGAKGEVVDLKSGKVLFYFSNNLSGSEREADFKDLANKFGREFASRIMEAVQ